jgi:Na+/proline symporter
VYTDTLQTTFMLLGLVVCIVYILQHSGLSLGAAFQQLEGHGFTSVFNTDVRSDGFFGKQILGGMFIAIAMTGLDQEMMQKNISVKNLRDSKKNVVTFSFIMALVSFLFLLLGGLLYLYSLHVGAAYQGKTLMLGGQNVIGDKLFPTIALHYLPQWVSIIFIIGLISALFPSADGALTALTSSFCIDLLDIKNRPGTDEGRQRRTRMTVHITFAVVFLLCILVFKWVNKDSIVYLILELAGYTYGPLLGLFAFGVFTKRMLPDDMRVTVICLLAPVCCYFLKAGSLASGFHIGLELLLINGILTFLGLWALSRPKGN